jgi:uncharacterized YigZ family protein
MNSQDTYRTIKQRSEGSFRDRGSKFLAFAFPVYSTDEIKTILAYLKKDYHGARHHCYAYRLGAAKAVYRTYDDGEPSGSAGNPILGQIRSFDLSNILIVVVRYFGGTLLGVGGLINAYRSAAASALQNATIITEAEQDLIEMEFPYAMMHEVLKIIRDEGMKLQAQDYDEACRIRALIRKSRTSRLIERFSGRQEIHIRML